MEGATPTRHSSPDRVQTMKAKDLSMRMSGVGIRSIGEERMTEDGLEVLRVLNNFLYSHLR